MNALRKRLTYANVISSLALFLVLAGGSAFAASQLGKKSVGSKQLKKNSVTAAKIKKNAVTAAKIKANAIVGAKLKKGSVTGAKVAAGTLTGANIANGSITGAQINAPSTVFTQATARLRIPGLPSPESESPPTLLGTYTQPANETDQFVGGADVNIPASCTGGGGAVIFLLENPASLNEISPLDIAGFAFGVSESGGGVTKHAEFVQFPESLRGLTAVSRPTPTTHTFYVAAEAGCEGGSGVTISNVGLDVLGTK